MIRHAILSAIAIVAVIAALVGVWIKGLPFDASVDLNEVSVHNNELPPLKDAVVTISLDNEQKSDTLSDISSTGMFKNIPSRFLGEQVRISVVAADWLPVDTTLELTRHTTINLQRDPKVYGDICFSVWDPHKESTITIPANIGGMELKTDAEGKMRLMIPLEKQRTKYVVTTTQPLENDTIYMPRGENDVLVVKH